MPVPARIPSWAWVTGLTVGAVAAVAVLAVQADQGPHPTATAARPSSSASPSARPTPTESAPAAVPDGSGTGRRIVYSLGQKRVWLVDASDATRRTFAVWPGTVAPDPGTYAVSMRREATTGSDGVQIEHVLYFTAKNGISIAFSNEVNGASPPPPASGTQTGGIRMPKPDGSALWAFGTTGTSVVVVK
ncbi:hypothetical protein AB0K80_03680 [Streptomyces sp. NPDC052682]|uniref:hypothetical protein n=1 Tax=Streptomyces sp. NPDC052682 TaxID=3154954 RepID=UPI003439531A